MTSDHTPHLGLMLDQWLTTSRTALHKALDEVLDLDTGLVDAILITQYDTLTAELGQVLDLDTGLQDIQPRATRSIQTTDRAAGTALLTDYALHVAARPAHERLVTRTWFPQHELVALHVISAADHELRDLGRALELAYALARALDRDFDLARPRVRDLALTLIRELDLALARGLDHIRALDRALVRGRVRVHGLVRVHGRDLELVLGLALDLARGLARELTSGRGHVHEFGRCLARGLDRTRGLELERGLVRDLVRNLAVARERALERGLRRAHADVAARTRDHLLAIDNNDLAASLAYLLTRGDALTSQDLDTALPQLEQALTDVTGADLTHANLNGVPLDGVLWSTDTCWPTHLREHVIRNSRHIGSGLYRIRPRGIGKETFVDLNI